MNRKRATHNGALRRVLRSLAQALFELLEILHVLERQLVVDQRNVVERIELARHVFDKLAAIGRVKATHDVINRADLSRGALAVMTRQKNTTASRSSTGRTGEQANGRDKQTQARTPKHILERLC